MLSGSRPSAVSLYTRDPLKLSTKPRMIGCLDPLVPIVVKSSRRGYYCPLNLFIYQRTCILEKDSCIGNVFFKFELSCCIEEVCESVDKAAVVGASTDACMKWGLPLKLQLNHAFLPYLYQSFITRGFGCLWLKPPYRRATSEYVYIINIYRHSLTCTSTLSHRSTIFCSLNPSSI